MKRLYWYLRVFGIQGVLLAFISVSVKKSVKVNFYSIKLNTWLTLRTKTSDLAVYEKVINNNEYSLPKEINPAVIIDAGANIGISALYFSVTYPDAIVIAVEPELSNFNMLVNNSLKYNNICPLRAAIWYENIPVSLHGETNSDFKINTELSEKQVDGITIDELLNRYSLNHVDVLKMDIEGAEKEVFESSDKWIEKVELLVIELHDRFKLGCKKSVDNATATFSKSWEYGENSFYLRKNNISEDTI